MYPLRCDAFFILALGSSRLGHPFIVSFGNLRERPQIWFRFNFYPGACKDLAPILFICLVYPRSFPDIGVFLVDLVAGRVPPGVKITDLRH